MCAIVLGCLKCPLVNLLLQENHKHVSDTPCFLGNRTDSLTRLFSAHLGNSSQPTTRPSYNAAHSQIAARPVFQRGTSALSTHSPSGHQHLPVYEPKEARKPKKNTLLNRIAKQQRDRFPNQYYSNGTATSFNWRSGRPMAGMLEMERSRTRRERTFIGSECAVCEEPLEHTLRGERILQFSCGHVSHEACFYEYIKEFDSQYCPTCNAPLGLDTSRGGNVLDLGMHVIASA